MTVHTRKHRFLKLMRDLFTARSLAKTSLLPMQSRIFYQLPSEVRNPLTGLKRKITVRSPNTSRKSNKTFKTSIL